MKTFNEKVIKILDDYADYTMFRVGYIAPQKNMKNSEEALLALHRLIKSTKHPRK